MRARLQAQGPLAHQTDGAAVVVRLPQSVTHRVNGRGAEVRCASTHRTAHRTRHWGIARGNGTSVHRLTLALQLGRQENRTPFMQIRCALVGMPGSGKSTVGRQLAHRAGVAVGGGLPLLPRLSDGQAGLVPVALRA